MKVKALFYTLLALTGAYTCFAQQPLLRHYTVQDGLPSNVVYNVFQDSRDFVWFCTDQGVCQFNGHHFQNYSIREGLPDNEVFTLGEDNHHRFWLVCYNHQPCYILDGKVYNTSNDSLCRQVAHEGIEYTTIFKNKDGFACLGGKRLCILNDNSISVPYPNVSFAGGPLDCIVQDGKEYFLDVNNFSRISNGSKHNLSSVTFQTSYYHNGHLYLFSIGPNHLLQDLIVRNDSLINVRKVSTPHWIFGFDGSSDSSLLCFMENGIMRYSPQTGHFTAAGIIQANIPVNRMLVDDEHNRWFTTLKDGVYLQLKARPHVYNQNSGLKDNNVLAVSTTDLGAPIASFNNGSFSVIGTTGTKTYTVPAASSANRVKFTYQITSTSFVTGSDQGLYVINAASGKCVLLHPEAQKDGKVVGDHFLTAISSGAGRYDIPSKTFTLFWNQRTTAIAEDDAGNVWLGSLNGLYVHYKDTTVQYHGDSILAVSRITGLAVTNKNDVVIATHKNGLFVLHGDKIQRLDEAHGISSNGCKKLKQDDEGNIWLCTDRGLDRITLGVYPQYNIYHYSVSDGLPTDNVNDVAVHKRQIFVATTEGIILLTKELGTLPPAPRIYILSLSIHDSVFSPSSKLDLAHHQNDIQITYTGVSLAGGKDLKYRYVLKGGSNNDTVYTRLSALNLSALKPGEYTLAVWAYANGQWSLLPAICSFTINPPVWLAPWFLILVSLFVIACLYMLYHRKVRNIHTVAEEKTRREKRMAELEMQALRAQINPHFIFNALNSIQHFYSQNNELQANHYLTLFAQLIRRTLNYSRSHWLTLTEELSMLRDYVELEQMRFKNVFTYKIVVSNNLNPELIKIPALLIQPYVENAINHGLRHLHDRRGSLLIMFELVNTGLRCIIEDNGVGMEASKNLSTNTHKSLGMEINLQRMETINQLYDTNITVSVQNKESLTTPASIGTRVTIQIPKKELYE
jgi:hypothetical protein